ncbi:MAG: hypothetical protein Q9223_003487 [Gallowayella weberi]
MSECEGWLAFVPAENSSVGGLYDLNSSYDTYRNETNLSDGADAIRPVSGMLQMVSTVPAGILHELYVPWPGAETGIHSTIWHVTTRNFFAVMANANASALVGTTLHEALYRLFEHINMFLSMMCAATFWPSPTPGASLPALVMQPLTKPQICQL